MDNSNVTYYDILIIGCGLSGAVLAERFASELNKKVLIIDKRDHIGGNCYDYIDKQTKIRVSKYGAHLFHTNHQDVWDYVNRFSEWTRWEHKVLAEVDGKLVSMPVNITTVNQLCGQNIMNEEEMLEWLEDTQIKYDEIENSEQMAKSRIGEDLYEKLVKHYTFKQWDKYPEELDASVLARIPIRTNFDTRYFTDRYQALPKNGYTAFFEKLLSHPNITVRLGVDFFESGWKNLEGKTVIYTGPIDTYFAERGLEKLEYRSIDFHCERHMNTNFFQPNSVVNYPGAEYPFTRIVEYKHMLHQDSPHTIVFYEITNDNGEPYYPVPNKKNQELYTKYQKLAEQEEKEKNVYFIGRLASYKYFNMDQAIKNALDFFTQFQIDEKIEN